VSALPPLACFVDACHTCSSSSSSSSTQTVKTGCRVEIGAPRCGCSRSPAASATTAQDATSHKPQPRSDYAIGGIPVMLCNIPKITTKQQPEIVATAPLLPQQRQTQQAHRKAAAKPHTMNQVLERKQKCSSSGTP
jgi:hypothetical protein